MQTRTAIVMATGFLSLGACSTPQAGIGLDGHRTVFHNPYAPIELENGPVGPEQCQNCPGGVWIDGLFYPGSGRVAYDRLGNRVRLSRSERRDARERFRLIRSQVEQDAAVAQFNQGLVNQGQGGSTPPPIPSAPPVSDAPTQSGSGSANGDALPPQNGVQTANREPR